ncbi:hypothetical protein HDU76_002598 [Blyttiomyces sp. JEL0837]|nr:hypothetical protein HDU76_002598 [Blyttiomyces sp. JEL0837]
MAAPPPPPPNASRRPQSTMSSMAYSQSRQQHLHHPQQHHHYLDEYDEYEDEDDLGRFMIGCVACETGAVHGHSHHHHSHSHAVGATAAPALHPYLQQQQPRHRYASTGVLPSSSMVGGAVGGRTVMLNPHPYVQSRPTKQQLLQQQLQQQQQQSMSHSRASMQSAMSLGSLPSSHRHPHPSSHHHYAPSSAMVEPIPHHHSHSQHRASYYSEMTDMPPPRRYRQQQQQQQLPPSSSMVHSQSESNLHNLHNNQHHHQQYLHQSLPPTPTPSSSNSSTAPLSASSTHSQHSNLRYQYPPVSSSSSSKYPDEQFIAPTPLTHSQQHGHSTTSSTYQNPPTPPPLTPLTGPMLTSISMGGVTGIPQIQVTQPTPRTSSNAATQQAAIAPSTTTTATTNTDSVSHSNGIGSMSSPHTTDSTGGGGGNGGMILSPSLTNSTTMTSPPSSEFPASIAMAPVSAIGKRGSTIPSSKQMGGVKGSSSSLVDVKGKAVVAQLMEQQKQQQQQQQSRLRQGSPLIVGVAAGIRRSSVVTANVNANWSTISTKNAVVVGSSGGVESETQTSPVDTERGGVGGDVRDTTEERGKHVNEPDEKEGSTVKSLERGGKVSERFSTIRRRSTVVGAQSLSLSRNGGVREYDHHQPKDDELDGVEMVAGRKRLSGTGGGGEAFRLVDEVRRGNGGGDGEEEGVVEQQQQQQQTLGRGVGGKGSRRVSLIGGVTTTSQRRLSGVRVPVSVLNSLTNANEAGTGDGIVANGSMAVGGEAEDLYDPDDVFEEALSREYDEDDEENVDGEDGGDEFDNGGSGSSIVADPLATWLSKMGPISTDMLTDDSFEQSVLTPVSDFGDAVEAPVVEQQVDRVQSQSPLLTIPVTRTLSDLGKWAMQALSIMRTGSANSNKEEVVVVETTTEEDVCAPSSVVVEKLERYAEEIVSASVGESEEKRGVDVDELEGAFEGTDNVEEQFGDDEGLGGVHNNNGGGSIDISNSSPTGSNALRTCLHGANDSPDATSSQSTLDDCCVEGNEIDHDHHERKGKRTDDSPVVSQAELYRKLHALRVAERLMNCTPPQSGEVSSSNSTFVMENDSPDSFRVRGGNGGGRHINGNEASGNGEREMLLVESQSSPVSVVVSIDGDRELGGLGGGSVASESSPRNGSDGERDSERESEREKGERGILRGRSSGRVGDGGLDGGDNSDERGRVRGSSTRRGESRRRVQFAAHDEMVPTEEPEFKGLEMWESFRRVRENGGNGGGAVVVSPTSISSVEAEDGDRSNVRPISFFCETSPVVRDEVFEEPMNFHAVVEETRKSGLFGMDSSTSAFVDANETLGRVGKSVRSAIKPLPQNCSVDSGKDVVVESADAGAQTSLSTVTPQVIASSNSTSTTTSTTVSPATLSKQQMDATRRGVVAELVTTERTYVAELATFVQLYHQPMNGHPRIEPDILSALFSNVQEILELHRESVLPFLERMFRSKVDAGGSSTLRRQSRDNGGAAAGGGNRNSRSKSVEPRGSFDDGENGFGRSGFDGERDERRGRAREDEEVFEQDDDEPERQETLSRRGSKRPQIVGVGLVSEKKTWYSSLGRAGGNGSSNGVAAASSTTTTTTTTRTSVTVAVSPRGKFLNHRRRSMSCESLRSDRDADEVVRRPPSTADDGPVADSRGRTSSRAKADASITHMAELFIALFDAGVFQAYENYVSRLDVAQVIAVELVKKAAVVGTHPSLNHSGGNNNNNPGHPAAFMDSNDDVGRGGKVRRSTSVSKRWTESREKMSSSQRAWVILSQFDARSVASAAKVVKMAMEDPMHGQISLSAYLLLPLQRITRYAILLERLLAATPRDYTGYAALQGATQKVRQALESCNHARHVTETDLSAVSALSRSQESSALEIPPIPRIVERHAGKAAVVGEVKETNASAKVTSNRTLSRSRSRTREHVPPPIVTSDLNVNGHSTRHHTRHQSQPTHSQQHQNQQHQHQQHQSQQLSSSSSSQPNLQHHRSHSAQQPQPRGKDNAVANQTTTTKDRDATLSRRHSRRLTVTGKATAEVSTMDAQFASTKQVTADMVNFEIEDEREARHHHRQEESRSRAASASRKVSRRLGMGKGVEDGDGQRESERERDIVDVDTEKEKGEEKVGNWLRKAKSSIFKFGTGK